MSSFLASKATPLHEAQIFALKALRPGPASFAELLAGGASGVACVSLVKKGLADVSMETGQKVWELTEAGLALLNWLA